MAGSQNTTIPKPVTVEGPPIGVTITPKTPIQPNVEVVQSPPSFLENFAPPAVNLANLPKKGIADRVSTKAEVGAPVPIIFGTEPSGGNIVRGKYYEGKYWVVIVWCEGGVDQIVSVYNSDTTSVTSKGTHYPNGGVDLNVLAIWGQADDLANVCYSVYAMEEGWTYQFLAIIRGRRLHDPRIPGNVFSSNAMLVLAHYVDRYSDYKPNWESVAICANRCGETVGDSMRWECNITLEEPRDHDANIAALKEYANVFIYIEAGEMFFVPDAPRDVDHVLTPDMFRKLRSPLRGARQSDIPTQVLCDYTAYRNGQFVDDQSSTDEPPSGLPLRRSRLNMSGFRTANMATRKCIETYNKALLARYDTELELFDYGIKVATGDRIQLTSTMGINEEDFRVLDIYPIEPGRWRALVRYYNALMWSDSVVTEPSSDSNTGPDPRVVPLVTGLTLTEEQYELQTGNWSTRIRATWSAPDFPFKKDYEIVITNGAVEVARSMSSDPIAVFGPLQENKTYTVKVRILGVFATGSFAVASKVAEGKTQRPSPPSLFVVFEAGGEVFFRWVSGIDHLDWRGEEVRYGAPGTPWAEMLTVNRWNGTQGSSKLIPVGTWDFEIRTFDSVRTPAEPFGQYSITGLRATETVDNDSNAFHIDDYSLAYDAAESFGMINLDGTYYTDGGDTWNDMFGSNPMSAFPNPVNTYTTDTAAKWVSAVHDFGHDLTATIQVSPTALALVGDVSFSIETRTGTTGPWVSHPGTSIKTLLRQFRVIYETAAAERIIVPPGYGIAAADVIPISREGSFTTDGIGFTLYTLPVNFSVFTSIQVSAPGLARRAIYEDPTPGDPTTIELAIVEGSTHVAATGYWNVKGY